MKEKLEEIYLVHAKKIWVAVILIVAISVATILIRTDKQGEIESLDLDSGMLEMRVKSVHDTFSLLQDYNLGYKDGRIAYEYDIYLKKPFITRSQFNSTLRDLIELLKYKYNDPSKDQYFVGLKVNVYDRHDNYLEANVLPRATALYQLRDEDDKKREGEDDYSSSVDLRWEHTIAQKKAPNYDAYTTITNYNELNLANNVPYSDKEYAVLRKLLLYQELEGSFNAGLNTFLFWELGIPRFESQFLIFSQFENFRSTAKGYGENLTIFDNQQEELYAEYSLKNPRLLAYVLTGMVYDEKLAAKKALVRKNRNYYLPIYVKEAQRLVRELGGESGVAALEELAELESVDTNTKMDEGFTEEHSFDIDPNVDVINEGATLDTTHEYQEEGVEYYPEIDGTEDWELGVGE